MGTEHAYIHGADPDEQDRLALMNRLLNEGCLAQLELRGDERVLELGAGTGAFSADAARRLRRGGRLVAIERDERQHAELARRAADEPRIDARLGDAYDPPLTDDEWGSFDVVHARFLLEHLTEPERVVAVMVRAAKPGGRVVLIDDDHSLMRFDPDPGGMRELWDDYQEQYRRMGTDPLIGRRLVALLVEAGCVPVRATQVDYGGCAGEPAFGDLASNLARVVGTARDALVAEGAWDGARFDAALAAYGRWSERPDATIWYALPCAVGRRQG